MSLQGKSVLITRPEEQAAELVGEVERMGGHAVVFPTIRIVPPVSWDECDRILERIGTYNGLLFTSANGVNGFFGRLRDRGIALSQVRTYEIYAVGEKTRKEIERLGLSVRLIPGRYSGAALAAALARQGIRQKRLLFPRGDLGTDELLASLRGLGAVVDAVAVYNTVAPVRADAESFVCRIVAGEIDVVTFASPSAAKNFVAMLPPGVLARVRECTKIAVIGETTCDAVRRLGLHADIVAGESTARGLIRAIADYYV